jgi:D-alanyl-lipoteichoic acid acyltransferase DltB (MBOAT superfamily)
LATITEIWRRWRISLSRWLKDYLYISPGGNCKRKARQYLNLFITMLLGGLWHEAALRFVLWAVMHDAALP